MNNLLPFHDTLNQLPKVAASLCLLVGAALCFSSRFWNSLSIRSLCNLFRGMVNHCWAVLLRRWHFYEPVCLRLLPTIHCNCEGFKKSNCLGKLWQLPSLSLCECLLAASPAGSCPPPAIRHSWKWLVEMAIVGLNPWNWRAESIFCVRTW